MGEQSRLDRVTAPDCLDHLDRADTAAVRTMRDECGAEERRPSFVGRVLRGHLDLALAERARRTADGARPLAVSDRRTVLLAHLDRLQTAMVARYRDGRAAVDPAVLLPDVTR
jgi:hypothetical protein